MVDSCIHKAGAADEEPRERGLCRRGEDGLTTLEWLLIVAAVAGLAALAVVLVQNVVDDTAEQISGSSARKTAAQVAAARVTQNAHDNAPDDYSNADQWNEKAGDYRDECNRLQITYGDVDGLSVSWSLKDWASGDDATAWRASLDKEPDDTEGCSVS